MQEPRWWRAAHGGCTISSTEGGRRRSGRSWEMNFSLGGMGLGAKPQVCKPIQKKTVDKKSEEELAKEQQRLKVQKLQTVEDWAKRFLDEYLKGTGDTGQEQKKSAWSGYEIAMVQEIRCFIPGCAPIEVCIVFSKSGSSSKTGKIFKPAMDVTEEDTKSFVNNFCNSTSPADDETLNPPKDDAGSQSVRNEDHPFRCPCCDPDIKNFDRMLNGKDVFLDAGW